MFDKTQKDIDKLKIEKKGLEETVGFLRTEFNTLQKVVSEGDIKITRREIELEDKIKINDKETQKTNEVLDADRKAFQVEQARVQVLLGNVMEQKEKNFITLRSLNEKEKEIRQTKERLDKIEKKQQEKEVEMNKFQIGLDQRGVLLETNKVILEKGEQTFVEKNKGLLSQQQEIKKTKDKVEAEKIALEKVSIKQEIENKSLRDEKLIVVEDRKKIVQKEDNLKGKEKELLTHKEELKQNLEKVEEREKEIEKEKERLVSYENNLKARDIEMKIQNSVLVTKQAEFREDKRIFNLKSKNII